MPSACAAALLKSMIRSLANGPLSLIRTMTDLPVLGECAHNLVPNGNVRCAAVRSFMLNRSPLAVRRLCNSAPYQEAMPCWMTSATSSIVLEATEATDAAADATELAEATALEVKNLMASSGFKTISLWLRSDPNNCAAPCGSLAFKVGAGASVAAAACLLDSAGAWMATTGAWTLARSSVAQTGALPQRPHNNTSR